MEEDTSQTKPLKPKKSYTRIHSSSLLERFASQPFGSKEKDPTSSAKKIIPSSAISGLREDFKKTFLPLLIDVFELRQMIENAKMQKENPSWKHLDTVSKTPEEILNRLEQLQEDIEETQRWCSGVITQIAKGIQEAREILENHEETSSAKIPPTSPQASSPIKVTLLRKFLNKLGIPYGR